MVLYPPPSRIYLSLSVTQVWFCFMRNTFQANLKPKSPWDETLGDLPLIEGMRMFLFFCSFACSFVFVCFGIFVENGTDCIGHESWHGGCNCASVVSQIYCWALENIVKLKVHVKRIAKRLTTTTLALWSGRGKMSQVLTIAVRRDS